MRKSRGLCLKLGDGFNPVFANTALFSGVKQSPAELQPTAGVAQARGLLQAIKDMAFAMTGSGQSFRGVHYWRRSFSKDRFLKGRLCERPTGAKQSPGPVSGDCFVASLFAKTGCS